MKYIDLRSDTVSHPTPEMREAMANAEVGDDVFGDDPTVNRLQDDSAAMFGKEAGLFVASGTMGNLTAVLTHCGRGDEMILGKQSHIFTYEVASAVTYGGVQPNTLQVQQDGTLKLDEIRAAVRGDNVHFPTTRLICLENTQGSGAGGAPVPKSYMSDVAAIAREHDLKLHIDGARIFNAATYFDMPVQELVADADSVQFCLSKGLCAPVGSMLVGTHDFIERARKIRKSLGGGMRQAGILAAAGLIALNTMSQRLGEDHANARALAEGLAQLPYVQIDLDMVKTNMINITLSPDSPLNSEQIAQRLLAYGILVRPGGTYGFRFVTHYWIKREHVDQVLEALRAILSGDHRAAAD